jgi:hypothetical protein
MRQLVTCVSGLAVVATTLTLLEAGPPIPASMLKAEDADAIAAYLKSLP